MGKSTISMAIFNSKLLVYRRVSIDRNGAGNAESAQLLGRTILAINSGAKAGVVPGCRPRGWRMARMEEGIKNGDFTSKNMGISWNLTIINGDFT